jgi:hypothetical protein
MPQQENPEHAKASSLLSTSCPLDRRVITLITAMLVIHILIFAYTASSYFEQIKIGVIHPLGPLAGAVSDLALFVGVVLLNTKRCYASLFQVAAVGSVLAGYLLWSQPLPFFVTSFALLTYGFGLIISLFSWWAIRRHKRS